MDTKEKEVLFRILRPACCGQWDCVIHPNPSNPFYPKSPYKTVLKSLLKSCVWVRECMEISMGKKRAQEVYDGLNGVALHE